MTLGDFKVGVSAGVCCTKCTLNTGVNTNFEITHCSFCVVQQTFSIVVLYKIYIVPQVKIRDSDWPKHITCPFSNVTWHNITWMGVANKNGDRLYDLVDS
jgi:hypothetical protein